MVHSADMMFPLTAVSLYIMFILTRLSGMYFSKATVMMGVLLLQNCLAGKLVGEGVSLYPTMCLIVYMASG